MPERDPGTLVDFNFKIQIVRLTIGENLFGRHHFSIGHNLDEARTSGDDLIRPWAVQRDGVANKSFAIRRNNPAVSNRSGDLWRKGDFGANSHLPGRSQMQVAIPRREIVHGKSESVSESIRDVGTALCQAVAPRAEVDSFHWTELHVHPALSDALAAHAGKIGFAADLERKATVEQVIPHVPLGNTRCVHGAD